MNKKLVLPAVLMMVSVCAHAESDSDGEWEFEFMPYLWASAMTGDVQVKKPVSIGPISRTLPKTSVDMDFSDIWNILDFGAMGAFEARKDRVGLLFDAIYMKVSDSASVDGPLGLANFKAKATLKQTMISAGLAYRILDEETKFDLIGGARYVKMDLDVSVNATSPIPALDNRLGKVKRNPDRDWIDPYIGARVQHQLNNQWSIDGYADVGGFGVGSDFTWQASVGAGYKFTDNITGKFGYRYMSIDYDHDQFVYDMVLDGVYAGASIKF